METKSKYKSYLYNHYTRGGGIFLQPMSSILFQNEIIPFSTGINIDDMLNTFENNNMHVFNISFLEDRYCCITIIEKEPEKIQNSNKL